jgi:hypothetical protein
MACLKRLSGKLPAGTARRPKDSDLHAAFESRVGRVNWRDYALENINQFDRNETRGADDGYEDQGGLELLRYAGEG